LIVLLIKSVAFDKYYRNVNKADKYISSFKIVKQLYDSVKREVGLLYNSVIEFEMPKKLVKLIKIWVMRC